MRSVVSFEEFYESIWLKIPDIWRNADPDYGRPLQLLTLTLAQHFYYSFYLKIAAMDELFDPDKCPEKYLPFLAATLNWKLLGTDSNSWRNQIRHAPLLYKIKGTRKGITIAEKLIGYSVFMTELYRDYTGLIVPKEKLFNNFPVSVKIKPWFRKTSTDIATDIFNDTFSDLLPSFNQNSGDISTLGNLIIPRQLKKTNSRTVALSTLPNYNPVTGDGSLARLAKLPRINIVLKKDLELDAVDSTGKYLDANLNEALDLFLQFKPFHIYVNDLLVMYDMSDYVFGSLLDKTAGFGDIPGDAILSREFADIYVTVQEDDTISYYNQTQLGSCVADNLETADTSLFKGNLEIKYTGLTLDPTKIVTNVARLTSLGLSLSGYARNYQTANGTIIWVSSDFSYVSSPDFPNNPSASILMDTATNTIKYSDIYPVPIYSFIEVPVNLDYICNLYQLINSITPITLDSTGWYTTAVSAVTINSLGFCKDTVTVTGKTYSYDPLISPQISPISLAGITAIRQRLGSTLNYSLFDTSTNTNSILNLMSGTSTQSTLEFFRALLKDNLIVTATYNATDVLLKLKKDFVFDVSNSSFIFNVKELVTYFSVTNLTDFINNVKFNVLYPTLIPFSADFLTVSINRSLNVADKRENSNFNRITYLDNSAIQTEIDTAHYTPILDFDDATGTLIEDTAKTQLYKEALPRLFARNSLHSQATGTIYSAVNYNQRNARDTSAWTVYIDPASTLYLGAERLSRTIWANYHNVPFSGAATVPYSSIDISSSAQITNRQSFRWLATLNNTTVTDPEYFVSSRLETDARNSLWTRGSAQKMARPYIGSSRNTLQGFRDRNALFNRTENLTDYHISLLANYNTDNYKYIVNDIDYTDMYRNPTIPFNPMPHPTTEIPVALKAKLIDGKIIYPTYIKNNYTDVGYIPQYDSPFDFTANEMYYQSNTSLKPSLYANNIRTDTCPYSGDLLDDFADPTEINVDGLQQNYATFIVTNLNDTEFVLPKTNIFVVWREINTGDVLGTGLFPLVDYTKVRPNVKVLKNGIEISYGYWSLASNPNRILIDTSVLPLAISDVLSVEYYTLNGIELPTYPADPTTGIAYTTANSYVYDETLTIPSNFDRILKENILEYTFNHRPIISWYRGDTGAFISVSVDTGNVIDAPNPKLYRDLAYPNITIRKNGIDVTFRIYWNFISIPSTGVSFKIAFEQAFTQALQPGDIISISYTGLI